MAVTESVFPALDFSMLVKKNRIIASSDDVLSDVEPVDWFIDDEDNGDDICVKQET